MQRHNKNRHRQIGSGERDKKIVLYFLQRTIAEDGYDDQRISDDGHGDNNLNERNILLADIPRLL